MFVCPKCGAKFTRWANLQQHLERKDHNGPHRFKRNSVIESFKNSETNDIETFQMDNFEPTNYLETNLVNEEEELQVNLCQKLLFLHQLTHNMTTYCSLNYKFNT